MTCWWKRSVSRLVRADKRHNNSPAWIHEPFLLCVNTPGWWTWWNGLGNAFVAYFRLFTAYLTIVAKHLPSFLPFWPQFTILYFQHVTIVKVLSNWLHEHDNLFRVLQWWSHSPDLYLIEHLYDVMEWEVPKTLQAVKSTWTVCVVLIINCSVSVYLEYFTQAVWYSKLYWQLFLHLGLFVFDGLWILTCNFKIYFESIFLSFKISRAV